MILNVSKFVLLDIFLDRDLFHDVYIDVYKFYFAYTCICFDILHIGTYFGFFCLILKTYFMVFGAKYKKKNTFYFI